MNLLSKLLVFALLFNLSSCGKKPGGASESSKKPEREERDVVIGDYLKLQQLKCHKDDECPEYLVKVIVENAGVRTQCSGVLIDDNQILTSASCLPRRFRIPQLKCANKIFAIFPETKNIRSEVFGCSRVKEVSNNIFSEQSLWKSDFLIFSLDREVKRSSSRTSILGLKNNEELDIWKIENKSDYLGIIKKDKCSIIHESYLNPFADHHFSPMHVARDCNLSSSQSGTPLMRNNIVAGVYSTEMNKSMYDYLRSGDLLSETLARYFHISNTVCSRYLNFNVLNRGEITPPECNPVISHGRLDRLRSNILKGQSIHQGNMTQIQDEIELPQRYFKWDVKFFTDTRTNRFEGNLTRPKCIFKSSDWAWEFRSRVTRRYFTYGRIEFSTPSFELKTKLNANLKPVSVVNATDEKLYIVEFNPASAHIQKVTDVTITSKLFGKEIVKMYDGVTTDCTN